MTRRIEEIAAKSSHRRNLIVTLLMALGFDLVILFYPSLRAGFNMLLNPAMGLENYLVLVAFPLLAAFPVLISILYLLRGNVALASVQRLIIVCIAVVSLLLVSGLVLFRDIHIIAFTLAPLLSAFWVNRLVCRVPAP